MKKFFGEFKKFITRGNIVDMAVGVIVGSSFTAIVNALSNNILKPVINWLLAIILGKDALSELFTFLKRVDLEGTTTPDLANSIYIDWGAFILAVINFLIIAFVLFCIVKFINSMRDNANELDKKAKKITKEDRKAMKAQGIKPRDTEAVKAYFEAKEAAEAALKAEEEAAEKAKQEAERLANPTTEDLLKAILAEIKKD